MSRNAELVARAKMVLPAGVNSPVRAFRAVGGDPLMIASAKGATIRDVEGQGYLDFVGSWGPLILGHAHEEVVEAVANAASRGTTYGAPCEPEVELAEWIVAAYPGVEQIRCTSSGTEAVMSAIRLARGATSRDEIVKFSGCYHGHTDSLLVQAGSGLVTFGSPSSAGIPEDVVKATHVLPLNDLNAFEDLMNARGDKIAAVFIEPIPANNGLLLQTSEYLQGLRAITAKHGTLLVFDEVISGFRVSKGGAAELYGITPDIATFGKVIGGGLPVGAFGASRKVMENLAPLGGVYQAGTLSGNPVAMTSGLTTLRILERENGWAKLDAMGAKLEQLMQAAMAGSAEPLSWVRQGSIFWMSLQPGEAPRTAECIRDAAAPRYKQLFHHLLSNGIAIAPSAYEVGFISLAHTEADLERLATTLTQALKQPTAGD